MSYYKPKIATIVNLLSPRDKKPAFKLSQKQIEKLKTVGEIALAVLMVGAAPLTAVSLFLFDQFKRPSFGKRVFRSDLPYKKGMIPSKIIARKISKTFYYLKKNGYIELKPAGDDFSIKISQKGRKKIRRMRLDTLEIRSPGKWDGKWWAVVADVPVDFRSRADFFREKLKELGFYPLQRTVWVYPFDPRDEVDFAAAYFGIEHFVTAMRLDLMDPEDEKAIKGHFRKQGVI